MKNEIIKCEEELRQAMLNNDVVVLERLIHDDLVFIAPDGSPATKEIDINIYKNKIQKISILEPSEQLIKLFDDEAIVSVKMNIEGNINDISISGVYRYIRFWKRIDNSWKIIGGSVTIVNPSLFN